MIYLDSAATSLYKPESVQLAMLDALNNMASPGRGAHSAAMAAAECCYACREALGTLFHVSDPGRIVFTMNATHGLNIAIHSLVKKGTRVLISGYEHNSVVRPLHAIGADVHQIKTELFQPELFLNAVKRELSWAQVVVCTHVSNAFGYILPITALSALCRENHIPLIVDASQSAGILPLDAEKLGAAFLAFPGHKGLMGPQGTGVLICQNDAIPLLYGGSGSESRSPDMPDFFPDRLEAGTHNMPGIAGLLAASRYLLDQDFSDLRRRERSLLQQLALSLREIPELHVFYTPEDSRQCSVLSVLPRNMDAETFGERLSAEKICVRAGLHCAPLAHETVGTLNTGTVRFSFSFFNTERQIGQTAEICKKIMKNP